MGMSTRERRIDAADDGQWIRDAVAEHEKPLVLYAQRLLHDAERARDVVQDTFLRLCRQKRGDVESHLAPWLYKVCRNRAMDVLRKERRMTPLTDPLADHQAAAEPSPAAKVETDDAAAHALRLIETLPPRQQEVLRLKFQSGLSYRQIAEVAGISVGNVGFLIHTALKALRHQLAPEQA